MKINTDPMNMDALDFDGDMRDPEYCDSELRAVEASGESRDELCPCQQTQLKLNRRLTGGTRVTSAWQWPRDAVGITHKLCLTSSRPQMSCRIPFFSCVIYSVGNELLIVLLAS